MTIAISLKVHNGVVLAADSASTLEAQTSEGKKSVLNIFNTARKIFNLYKNEPIGFVGWGLGSIGPASISTLCKDLRRRFMCIEAGYPDYVLDKDNYTLQHVANLARKYFFEEKYVTEGLSQITPKPPSMGFIVAGYSSGENLAEEWQITIREGKCPEPELVRPKDETGITWAGEREVIHRLFSGYGTELPNVLAELGAPSDQIPKIMDIIESRLAMHWISPPMPIKDAIDLAKFLAEATIMFSRFTPGPPTVGGPVDIAAITKHEGFKWVGRKLWYPAELNPKEGV